MVKNNPSAWPESRAFQYLLRTLWRQRDYVAPYQPTNAFPLATAPTSTASGGGDAPEKASPAAKEPTPVVTIGSWSLTLNAAGDPVWRHSSGYEQIAAALPKTEDENHG